jgi:hypothetical protein
VSTGAVDLAEGRKILAIPNLQEIIAMGSRNECSMRISQIVLDKLTRLEAQNALGDKAPTSAASSNTRKQGSHVGSEALMAELEAEIRAAGAMTRSSVQEQFYWAARILAAVSLLGVLYFLFVHDA